MALNGLSYFHILMSRAIEKLLTHSLS